MDTQTAMLLTQEEWDDLEDMVDHYRMCTQWVEREDRNQKNNPGYIARLGRRRALATRIIEANLSLALRPSSYGRTLTPRHGGNNDV